MDDALRRWNAAKALGEFLNTARIEYQLFSTNSNAMANTLGLAMGFRPTRLSFEGPYMAPGLDIDLTREYGKEAPSSPYHIGKPIPLLKGGSPEDDGRRKFAALLDVEPRMDLLHRLGVAIMIPAAARRAIAAAKADDALGRRYVSNDRDAVDYMHALHRAAYPEASSDSPTMNEQGEHARGAPVRLAGLTWINVPRSWVCSSCPLSRGVHAGIIAIVA